jgi:hypothetical protein
MPFGARDCNDNLGLARYCARTAGYARRCEGSARSDEVEKPTIITPTETRLCELESSEEGASTRRSLRSWTDLP